MAPRTLGFRLRLVVAIGMIAPWLAGGCADQARQAELGRALYARHGCAACHGPAGRGDGPVAKTLNPPPRDLADAGLYQQGSSQQAIADTIRSGVFADGTNMPAFPNLTPAEARHLAAWIVTLQKPGDRSSAGSR